MKKRLIALVLVVVMVMSLAPAAFAVEVPDDVEDAVINVAAAIDKVLADPEAAYEKAYQYAEDEGYIAAAVNALEVAKEYLGEFDVEALEISDELKADLQAAIDAVAADIDPIIAYIEGGDSVDNLIDEFPGLVDALADDLDELQALAEQAGSDAYDVAVAAYNAVKTALDEYEKAFYDYLYAQIDEIYAGVADEIASLVGQYGPEAEAFIRQWILDNPQAFIDTVLAYGKDIDAFLKYWSYYAGLILGPAWDAYGKDIMGDVEAVFGDLIAGVQADADKLSKEAVAALIAYIDELNIDGQLADIVAAAGDAYTALAEETFEELVAIVEELKKGIEEDVDDIVAALEEVAASEDAAAAKDAVEEAIDKVLAEEEELLAQVDVIMDAVLAAKAEAEAEFADVASYEQAALEAIAIIENFDAEQDYPEAVEAVNALIDMTTRVGDAIKGAADVVKELSDEIAAAGTKIDAEIVCMYNGLCDTMGQVEDTLVAAGKDAVAILEDTLAAVDALVITTVDKVTNDILVAAAAVVDFVKSLEDDVVAFVDAFLAEIEALLYKATHGDLFVNGRTSYVAIGDPEDVYTSELADLIGLKAYQVESEINANTDLVTVDFGGPEFSDFISAQAAGYVAEIIKTNETLMGLMSGNYAEAIVGALSSFGLDLTAEVAELDWDKYLDEKAIAVKDETIAGIRTTAVDNGLMEVYTVDVGAMIQPVLDAETGVPGMVTVNCVVDIPVADLACALLDNVLYCYISFAADYVGTLEDIHATAPGAEVVVLGLADADEDLVFSVGEVAVDLGEYTDIFADFINVHYFAYALVNGEDTTYVAVNTAEAIYNALNIRRNEWWVCDGTNCACDHFTDLKKDAWYHNAICYCWNFDLMIGMSDDKFEPSTTTSRAMIVTTLYRLEGSPAVTGKNTYKDVKDGVWYTDAIIWATENGIVNGYGDGLFGPANDVTREQIATMLYRYAEYVGLNMAPKADLSAYTDAGEISAWALDAMKWTNAVELIEGRSATTLNPRDNTMRSELATLLYRWCNEYVG